MGREGARNGRVWKMMRYFTCGMHLGFGWDRLCSEWGGRFMTAMVYLRGMKINDFYGRMQCDALNFNCVLFVVICGNMLGYLLADLASWLLFLVLDLDSH
jgi:hypothetical protein